VSIPLYLRVYTLTSTLRVVYRIDTIRWLLYSSGAITGTSPGRIISQLLGFEPAIDTIL